MFVIAMAIADCFHKLNGKQTSKNYNLVETNYKNLIIPNFAHVFVAIIGNKFQPE